MYLHSSRVTFLKQVENNVNYSLITSDLNVNMHLIGFESWVIVEEGLAVERGAFRLTRSNGWVWRGWTRRGALGVESASVKWGLELPSLWP